MSNYDLVLGVHFFDKAGDGFIQVLTSNLLAFYLD